MSASFNPDIRLFFRFDYLRYLCNKGIQALYFLFCVFWFLGSALMGILYDISPVAIAAFSMAAELAAIPLFIIANRKTRVVAASQS